MSNPVERLSLPVQRWLHRRGWTSLRPIQASAIEPILSQRDVILAASTAAGKTEAAFLPILTHLIENTDLQEVGCQVLYIAPLKSLINDQADRLELMVEGMDILVTPWHGDSHAGRKRKFKETPDGILMITPESIEAMMVNYGHELVRRFQSLQYIVIDELHAYLGTERGKQLQSLLHRLGRVVGRPVPHIGLSATLGDLVQAAEFMCPGRADAVVVLHDSGEGDPVKLQLRAEILSDPVDPLAPSDDVDDQPDPIAEHLYKTLRGEHHLIFTNSRGQVEQYADMLSSLCEKDAVPNEFLPHHGSLSKELREFAESEIKKGTRPVSIVCTSTMEMGIDIGAVKSIAQIGTPFNVAALRQRLGRSGRRGEAAILRVYVKEERITERSSLPSLLREKVFQGTACLNLLVSGWVEPPDLSGLHLSTLIQQILSALAQYGGVTAQELWRILCGDKSPFRQVTKEIFVQLLGDLGEHDLVIQTNDGTLLHGVKGERLVNHYKFYAAFSTPDEFVLRSDSRVLGTLPVTRPLYTGAYILFGGRRWQVRNIDLSTMTIHVVPARGGLPPKFGGEPGTIADKVRETMFTLYQGSEMPTYLDREAQLLVHEGRQVFQRFKLQDHWVLSHGGGTYVFLWRGDKINDTLVALLAREGLLAENEGVSISLPGTPPNQVVEALERILASPPPDAMELADAITNKLLGKHDIYLSEELLNRNYASHRLDVSSTLHALQERINAQSQ